MPVLLLRHDKAGDAVKTLPALRALIQAVSLDLHLIVSSHNACLFETEPGVTSHVLPTHWQSLKPELLLSRLRQLGLPQSFEKIVSLLCDPFEETVRLLSLFPHCPSYAVMERKIDGIEALTLPGGTPAGRDETINIALLLSQAFGTDLLSHVSDVSQGPAFTEADHFEARTLMGAKAGTWMGLCPFAGLAHRSHPLEKWLSFLPWATRTSTVERFFLFGTLADYPAMEQLRKRCHNPAQVQLCFPSSFRALGAYLLRLDGVVAVDSGPLHLARALGVRSLGILSGGDARRWFPSETCPDPILRRGLLGRFPSSLEMLWAFRRWLPA